MSICDLSAWMAVVIVDAKAKRVLIANVCNQISDSSSKTLGDPRDHTRHSFHSHDDGKVGFQYGSRLGRLCSVLPCGVSFGMKEKWILFALYGARGHFDSWQHIFFCYRKRLRFFVVIPFILIVYLLCTLTTPLTAMNDLFWSPLCTLHTLSFFLFAVGKHLLPSYDQFIFSDFTL